MKKKILELFEKINNKFFFGKYKNTYKYINEESNFWEYFIKFMFIFITISVFLYLLFNNVFYSIVVAFAITMFFINEIFLNNKKTAYESHILSQLTIYTSQVSLIVTYNNIYSSLKEVTKFLDYPVKNDLENVISKIDKGMKVTEAFEEFNEKYNNRTITLFNQTLELFDEHGDSDAGTVLQIISEEMNMLKVKKDKFIKYKKEWRLNFYVVVILCLVMPIILRFMISDIYIDFMSSFGKFILIGIIIFNMIIIKKVESIYSDQTIGEGGYR